MKKMMVIAVLFAFAGAVYGASSVSSHATPALVDEINIALQSLSTTGDITLANGATIDEATADSVRVTVASTTSTLGILILESDNTVGHMADGDVIDIQMKAYDDKTNKTTYATIELEADDITDSTEDGAILFKTYVNGTNTTLGTINASGIAVNSGSFVGNGTSITNLAGGNIASGNIGIARLSAAIAAQTDTNDTTTATTYTPTFIGQMLIGKVGTTDSVWIATGVTTNDWTVKLTEQ